MRCSKWVGAIGAAVLTASCGAFQGATIPIPIGPKPVMYNDACVVTDAVSHQPIAGVRCVSEGQTGITNSDGYVLLLAIPAGDRLIVASQDGYESASAPFTNDHDQNVAIALTPIFPAPPTRDQVLGSHLTFQGLMVHQTCIEPNDLPWFDVALFTQQLAPCRDAIYQQKRDAGDTAAQIGFSQNARSLYDEANQPYQQLTTVDFEHQPDAFVAAVAEIIRHGFTPWVYLDGDGPCCYDIAIRQFPIVYAALAHSPYGDLNPYVLYRPGWDSIFYGWEPSHDKIPAFAALVRSLCPACHLGLEFNTGHIPIGEGGSDYLPPSGDMLGYDLLDVEFDDGNIHSDSTWQILARVLGPIARGGTYARPSDQPASDDPNPPWYLSQPTPRGRWYVNCFEYAEYEWVRGLFTLEQVKAMRAYLYAAGCPVVD